MSPFFRFLRCIIWIDYISGISVPSLRRLIIALCRTHSVPFFVNVIHSLDFTAYQKHHTPSLDDPIWRLKKISKQGASHKKLESKGIKTVKDFLMQYYLDPLSLRQVRT